MYRKLPVFASLICTILASTEAHTPFRKCTQEIPAPLTVQLNDCEGHPCVVKAGTPANITVQFTAVNKTTNVFAQIIVYLNGDAVPFHIPGDNEFVCNHLINDTKCPLEAGDSATYSVSIPMDRNLPDVFLATEVALVDDQGSCMSCFVTDIRIQSKGQHGSSEKNE